MSRKPNKALRRLDAALLEAAAPLPEETDPLNVYKKNTQHTQHCKVYNADRADADLERYSQQVLKLKRRFPFLAVLLLLVLLSGVLWILWQQGVISW